MCSEKMKSVTVEDVVKKIDPTEIIGIMGPGFRGNKYMGQALGAVERRDLMEKEVFRIGRDMIDNGTRICIYTEE